MLGLTTRVAETLRWFIGSSLENREGNRWLLYKRNLESSRSPRAGRKIASVSLSGEAAILVSIERRGSALASRTVTFYVSGHRRSPAAALPVFPSGVVLWRRIQAGFNATFHNRKYLYT